MSQQMMPDLKRKRKTKVKVEFDAGKVFDVKPSVEINLDEDMSRYKAQKGQGGDRRT